MFVFDASPLIVLATAERLGLIDDLEERCCTTARVYEEVVTTGIEAGQADARRIERAVDAGSIHVRETGENDLLVRLRENDRLSEADATVLATAAAVDGRVVMDEEYGRDVADVEGIEARGTAYLVLLAQKRDVLDADVARAIVDDLLDAGWYCAPDLYAEIRRKIEALAD